MLWSVSRSLGFGSVVILVSVQRGPRYPTSEQPAVWFASTQ